MKNIDSAFVVPMKDFSSVDPRYSERGIERHRATELERGREREREREREGGRETP